MPTTQLRDSLDQYAKVWPAGHLRFPAFDRQEEMARVESIRSFITLHPNALERECVPGHITGSALVVNPALNKVLLTLHAKLGKWLQLGGHADGESDVAASALREAREESGRDEVEFYPWEKSLGLQDISKSPLAIDCDIHEIPAHGEHPSHLHYDLRYLCVLDDSLPLHITSESKDLRWLTIDEALAVTSELSMLRQFEKLAAIKRLIQNPRVAQ